MLKVIKQIRYEGNNTIECGVYEGNISNSIVNIYVDEKWFDIDFGSIKIRKMYVIKATQ